MQDLDKLYDILREEEGLELKPYEDTEGVFTIGYGRNLRDKGISKEEAKVLLANDIAESVTIARSLFPEWAGHSSARQVVLAAMVFQMGRAGVAAFQEMRKALMSGNYEVAADEMLDSKWARQTPARANRMADIMRAGDYAG
jgi:lysozyme